MCRMPGRFFRLYMRFLSYVCRCFSMQERFFFRVHGVFFSCVGALLFSCE